MDPSQQAPKISPAAAGPARSERGSALAEDLEGIVSRVGPLWDGLRGGTLLISGGTGFFGRWLLESFVEADRRLGLDSRLIVLSRDPDRFRTAFPTLAGAESVDLVAGDVRTFRACELEAQLGAASPRRISHVIHAASETTVAANRDHPLGVLETAYEGTRRLLAVAESLGAERFLLTSSGAVYGTQPVDLERVPETFCGAPDVRMPMSAYGEGKRVAELLCHARTHAGSLDCRIARCFAFVGPHLDLDAHYAIGNFLRDALAGRAIEVNGDGTPWRSYLYAADLAVWLWTLLLDPRAKGAYNVGSDEAFTIAEVAARVSRQSPGGAPVTIARAADMQRPGTRYVPDISRARRELGLDVWTSLDAAISKTLGFHQLNSRTHP